MVLAGATICGFSARGEFIFSLYSGATFNQNGDLEYKQSGGTDLTFHDASYRSQNFRSPPYYGARLSYFLGEDSHWGLGMEFFHAKLYLDTGSTVPVTGTRAGAAVNDNEPISNTLNSFNTSHGLNFLTWDGMYRWFPNQRQGFIGRFQPYVGAGIGLLIPHVEADVPGAAHFEQYQVRGPGVVAFAGSTFDLTRHWLLFAEYKFSYANLDDLKVPGGSISTSPLIHHLAIGFGFRF